MRYLFSLLVLFGLMSCSSSQVSQYSKIEYYVGPCFGFCPVYTISIDSDRNAILEAEHFNFTEGNGRGDLDKPREGTFKSVLSKEDFEKLISLTDAADVKSLKNLYEDKRIMDASRSTLRVYFKDGSKKEINMSAGDKPERLVALYSFISDVKKNQKWEKVK